MHDLLLIEQIKQGNRIALEELVKKHYQQIYKYMYFRVSHTETAQDLTQEVFYKLTKSIHRFVPVAKFSTFLYQIAHNVVVDYYRSEKSRQENLKYVSASIKDKEDLDFKEHEIADTNETGISDAENRMDLIAALKQLPEEYRECITLYYFGQLKHREVAQILDIPVSTVKTRIRRGLEQCKTILGGSELYEN